MQKIRNYIQEITKSRFVKNLGITFFENITIKIFGFFITLILVRNLGPEHYGIYSFILVNVIVLSTLIDFGMENTAIRFSNKDKSTQNSIFGLYFLTKLAVLLICVFILIFWGKNILVGLHKPELIKYLPFFILGFLGESLFFVNDTYLQSVQQFKLRAIINITRYITLFSFVVFLVLNKLLFLKYVAFVFIIPVIFILFFIPRYLIFIKSFFKQKLSKNLFGEILKYEKWMIALAVVGAALSRVDIYMLSFLVNYAQLGIYSAAYNLISIVAFIPYSLGKVMFPKMSETPLKEVFGLTLRITKPILLMSVLLLLFIPIFHFIVPISFGHKYDGSIIIAQILLIATLISFVFLPVETSIYVIGKPKYVLLCRQIQLIILIVLNILTIPRFGMIWGAVNLVIARFVHGMILLYIFYREKEAYE